MATGWTWEYVWDNMTLQRLEVLNRLWKQCPPPNISLAKISKMIAAWTGTKDETPASIKKKPLPEFVNLPDFEE